MGATVTEVLDYKCGGTRELVTMVSTTGCAEELKHNNEHGKRRKHGKKHENRGKHGAHKRKRSRT